MPNCKLPLCSYDDHGASLLRILYHIFRGIYLGFRSPKVPGGQLINIVTLLPLRISSSNGEGWLWPGTRHWQIWEGVTRNAYGSATSEPDVQWK